MAISASTSNIAARHWLRMPVAGAGAGVELFLFTGVAVFGSDQIHGVSTAQWERGSAFINADYSNVIPRDRAIVPQHWTVDVNLASLLNLGHAVNTGWAADSFSLTREDNGLGGDKVTLAGGILRVRAEVAVRDSDASILRLSYNVSILGRVVGYQHPPIP